ncbi:MAG: hypothetical protein AB8D52_08560 [Gammaproteobacteria bacterium]
MKFRKKILSVLLFWSFMVTSSQADWAAISAEELANDSALIVIGEMIEVKVAQAPEKDHKVSVGVIQIQEVLKGEYHSETLFLTMPYVGEGVVRSSSDVNFTTGQNGLWYLQAIGNNHYSADRPDRFVKLDQAADQIQKLRCQKD